VEPRGEGKDRYGKNGRGGGAGERICIRFIQRLRAEQGKTKKYRDKNFEKGSKDPTRGNKQKERKGGGTTAGHRRHNKGQQCEHSKAPNYGASILEGKKTSRRRIS